jgi:hypothetical protein
VKFQLGRLLATPGCLAFCKDHEIDLLGLIARHANGDCGDMDPEDVQANAEAIRTGGRIFSSYAFGNEKIWIITNGTDDEGVRDATTAMLPDEY